MQINGMHQALIHESSLLCFQVCRFTNHEQADLRAFDFGLPKYSIDMFTDGLTSKVALMYCLVALVAYTGDSVRGHYQGAVRVMAEGVSSWLICDDNQTSTLHQNLSTPLDGLQSFSHLDD